MLALIEDSDEKMKTRSFETEVLGIHALTVRVPSASGKRRERILRRTVSLLNGLNIKTVCFADGFLNRAYFLEHGLCEPETRRFLAVKSAEILLAADKNLNSAAVISGIADEAAVAALNAVCFRVRCLMVDIGIETTGICSALRKKTGASVVEIPGRMMVKAADAAIVFRGAGERNFCEKCIVLCADRGAEDNVTGGRKVGSIEFSAAEKAGTVPAGYDRMLLLAEAFNEGKLEPAGTAVKSVDISD